MRRKIPPYFILNNCLKNVGFYYKFANSMFKIRLFLRIGKESEAAKKPLRKRII
ncbi:hypothetical protein CAMSH0001_0440 [Campylobacter showae RM3277]|uniref:Uncharacterized protein n=1 Tax=Campylobacter showae RM3277 TaxID=553219 RepID=C6RFD6_9BACT|nr:hypothetical protein CAMSH0001_0440 [Campylobacter showae RM3277]